MTDLERALRDRLATVGEPPLAPPPGLARALRRRHDRRRVAVPVAVAGLGTVAAAGAAALRPAGGSTARVASGPSATASATPAATPTMVGPRPAPPPRSGPWVEVAGLTFQAPYGFTPKEAVKRDEDAKGASTFVSLTGDGQSLGITVHEGARAKQWDSEPAGPVRATTISGYPADVVTFTGSVPPGVDDRPDEYVEVTVRISATRTVWVMGANMTEWQLVEMVGDALDRQ